MKSKTPEEFIRAEIAINLSGEIDRIIAEGLGIKIPKILYTPKGLYKEGDVIDRLNHKEILKNPSCGIKMEYFDAWETEEISKLEYEMRRIIKENA